MTNEVAIKVLNKMKYPYNCKARKLIISNVDRDNEALEMAIKALSQEPTVEKDPCETCGYAEGSPFCLQYCPYDAEKEPMRDATTEEQKSVNDYIKSISTPTGVKFDDAISRDMALEKMADYVASGYADSAEDFEEYSRIICQLPSVTQKSETVTEFADRCRECGAKYGKLLKQKSGKWIAHESNKDLCYCSECKTVRKWTNNRFCGFCGAKMVEPQESEGE